MIERSAHHCPLDTFLLHSDISEMCRKLLQQQE